MATRTSDRKKLISFRVAASDRALLERIHQAQRGKNLSETYRRLIRAEAERLQLADVEPRRAA